MHRSGVHVKNERVLEILAGDSGVTGVRTAHNIYKSNWVILATGGVSYPATGSTGDGYDMVRKLGHTIVPPEGSLGVLGRVLQGHFYL